MPAITFPTAAQNTTAAGVIALGKVYIGAVDTNPRVLGNRVNVTITQEDGTPVVIAPAAQPFVLNAGGLFEYNGSVVLLQTDAAYSLALDTADDVQVYYLPDSSAGSSTNTSVVVLPERESAPATISGSGQLFTLDMGGITELFYKDSEGNIIQFTEAGQIKVELTSTIIEALQLIAEEEVEGSQFRGEPVTLTIDESGNVDCDLQLGTNYYLLMDENVNTFSFSNAPEIRIPNIIVSIENAGSFTITTFEFTAEGGTVYVPAAYSGGLQPTASATTDYGLALFPGPGGVGQRLSIYPVLMQDITP